MQPHMLLSLGAGQLIAMGPTDLHEDAECNRI